MWIPSVLVILPKTLLKWTTPHCKSATKFKTKIVKPQLQAETVVVAAATTTTTTTIIIIFVAVIAPIISRIETEETTTAAAFSSEQHCRKLFVEYSLVASSSSSSSSSVSLCALVLIFFIGRFIHRSYHFLLYAVTLKLAFLMNDIRLKSLRKPTKILITTTAVLIEQIIALTEIATTKALKAIRTVLIGSKQIKQLHNNKNNNNNNNNNQLTILAILSKATTTKTLATASATRTKITTTQITNSSEATSTPILPSINSKNNITVAALVALRLFNKNSFSSNNHRTYNNGSKSNKVFLHYTPRDPRLRIANSNQEILINKHHFDSVSELKITEDLCAYGELIGGFFSTPATFKIVIANLVYCDCNQINCCCNHNNNNNRNNSESKSKSESKKEIENKFIVSDSTQRQLVYDKYSCKLKSSEEKEAQLSQRQQSSISIVNFVRNLQLGPKYLKAVTSAVGILL